MPSSVKKIRKLEKQFADCELRLEDLPQGKAVTPLNANNQEDEAAKKVIPKIPLHLPQDNAVSSLDELISFWLGYQKRWLADESMIKFAQKGRREGFTYVQAYEDVRDCVTKKYFRRGRPLYVWFSSADLSAAAQYIEYCKEFASLFNDIAEDLGEQIIDKDKDIKAYCIKFKNGARIYALSSNPSQFRSKGGKVVLDEFAHHDNQKELWKAAYASAKIWGYPIRVISTHNGKNSEFYKFIEKIEKGKLRYSLHTVPIQLAVDEGLADVTLGRKLTQKEREAWLEEIHLDAGDEMTWLEEFCCIPVDEATALLTYELIESCMSDDVLKPLDQITGDYYVGMDVARTKHLSVIAGNERLGDVNYIRQLETMQNVRFREQREALYKHFDHKTFKRSNMDGSGMGKQLGEDAEIDYGKTKIESLTFSASLKEELAYLMLRTFQDRTIRIPRDEALREDLHSMRKIVTSTNHIRFDADMSETDGHGDRFWAIALALHAVTKNITNNYTAIKTAGKRTTKRIARGYD